MFNFHFDWNLSSGAKTSIFIFLFLIIFFIVLGIVFSKMDPEKDEVPTKGLKFLIILYVDAMNNYVAENLGPERKKVYAPYFIAITSYLSLANIASMFGLTPPMSNLALALSMSVIAFLCFQITGWHFQGFKGRIEGWLGPVHAVSFLIFPISVFGEFTTPFSMGMRLFGNIFSGVILAGVTYALFDSLGVILGSILSTVITTVIFHTIFDFAFGMIQMVVYFMLSAQLVRQNM